MNIKLLLAVLFVLTLNLPADQGTRSSLMIVTLTGKTYENCRIFKTDPDGVMFFHRNGGAKVLFADMTPECRNLLGYDPAKAAAAEKDHADKLRRERELVAEYKRVAAKSQAMAAEMQNARYQQAIQQSYAMPYAGWNDGGIVTPYFGDGYVLEVPTFDAAAPINNKCQALGLTSFTTLQPKSAPCWSGAQRPLNTINTGTNFVCRPQAIPYGTPALRSLAPALGARPMTAGVGFFRHN